MRSRLALLSIVLVCVFLLTPLFSHAHYNPVSALAVTSDSETNADTDSNQSDNDHPVQTDTDDEHPEQPPENLPPQEPEYPDADSSEQPPVEPNEPQTPEQPPSPSPPADDEEVLITLPTEIIGDNTNEEYEEEEECEDEECEDEEYEELEYVAVWDDEIFEVQLPTCLNLDFIIDPHGIFFLTDEEIAALDIDSDSDRLGTIVDGVFHPLPTAGQVIFQNHTTAYIANNGNHPIMLEIDMRLVIISEHSEIIAVNSPDEVFTGEDENSIFIGASFSSQDVQPVTHFGSNYLINGETVPLLDTNQTHQFILDGAIPLHYTIISPENEIVQVGETHGLGTINNMQFTFSGKCNPAADWSILSKDVSIRISIVYSISNIW